MTKKTGKARDMCEREGFNVYGGNLFGNRPNHHLVNVCGVCVFVINRKWLTCVYRKR